MMDRRRFLAAGWSTLALPCLAHVETADGRMPANKDKRLKIITEDPLVLETPDELLAASRITPTSALFVRNHHGAKALGDMKSRPLVGNLKIGGLVRQQLTIPFSKLTTLDSIEVEMVLQCSGNFRSQFSRFSPIKGTPWNKGGIGNVRFRGVPLASVFKAIDLQIDPTARYLAAQGADQPENKTQVQYEKSIPLDVALSRGLLATEMNGEPLAAIHGGPLRLVIPGYYGTSQVKWLTTLRLDATESLNYYQTTDYRTPKRQLKPGEPFECNLANSDANFDMKVNSRLFMPADGSTVKGSFVARGVAWNDGTAELTSVDLSSDHGRTWRSADLAPAHGAFAFREWTLPMSLSVGRHQLWVRAVDAKGRTQPLDGGLHWNPGGYAWNGVEIVTVSVE